MKNLLYILPFAIILGCKDKKERTKEDSSIVEQKEKFIILSNYSDENFDRGVAKDLHLFLVDLTPENQELTKGISEIKLSNGQIIKITGTSENPPFIRLNTYEKAGDFIQNAASPNKIVIIK